MAGVNLPGESGQLGVDDFLSSEDSEIDFSRENSKDGNAESSNDDDEEEEEEESSGASSKASIAALRDEQLMGRRLARERRVYRNSNLVRTNFSYSI